MLKSGDNGRTLAFDRLVDVQRHLRTVFEGVYGLDCRPASLAIDDTRSSIAGPDNSMAVLATLRMSYAITPENRLSIVVAIGTTGNAYLASFMSRYEIIGTISAQTSRALIPLFPLLTDAFEMYGEEKIKL